MSLQRPLLTKPKLVLAAKEKCLQLRYHTQSGKRVYFKLRSITMITSSYHLTKATNMKDLRNLEKSGHFKESLRDKTQ